MYLKAQHAGGLGMSPGGVSRAEGRLSSSASAFLLPVGVTIVAAMCMFDRVSYGRRCW